MPTSSVERENVHNILVICNRSSCFNSTSTQLNLWALRKLKCVRGFFKGKTKGLLSVFENWNFPALSRTWASRFSAKHLFGLIECWNFGHLGHFTHFGHWDVLHISALFPHCRDLQGNRHLDYYVKETENSYTNHLVKNVLRSATFNPSFNTNV